MKRFLLLLAACIPLLLLFAVFPGVALAIAGSFDPTGGGNTLPTCNASRVGMAAYDLWGHVYVCSVNWGFYDWIKLW